MFGAILKATNSFFQKGMTYCCSIYVKKVMKLLAFIFEQPSYGEGSSKGKIMHSLLSICMNENTSFTKMVLLNILNAPTDHDVWLNKQVAQWATVAHLGTSILFGDTIIYGAQRQVTLNLKQ